MFHDHLGLTDPSILAVRPPRHPSVLGLYRDPTLRNAALLGLWGLQGLTYWYAGYFLAFVLGWMAIWLGREAAERIGWARLGRLYAAGAATCGGVLAYAVSRIMSKAGSGSIPMEAISSGNWLVPDTLLNYVGGFIRYQITEGHGYPMMQSWLWAPLFLWLPSQDEWALWLGAAVLTPPSPQDPNGPLATRSSACLST